MKLRHHALGPALLAVLVGLPAAATEFHVAPPPAGSDANPGTEAEPWATLQFAADQVGPGDTVVVHEGDYTGAHITTSGTTGAPIVFRAAPGEEPRIVADNPSTPDGLNIEEADWIVIEGFTVQGRTRAGIRAVLCANVTIRDNHSHDNGKWGILTGFCDDLLIEGNETTGSIDEHGIYVSNSGDRPTIRGNLIHGNAANGIHMNGDASLGGDGIISDALVEENVIFDNGLLGGSGINCDGVQDSLIRNNLIWNTHASGISLYRIDGGGPSSGNRVLHNTVLVASDGRWGLNVQSDSSGNTVENNVFFSRHGFRGAMDVCSPGCLVGFVSDHNVVEDVFTTDGGDSTLSLSEWQTLTGQDGSSEAIADPDPLFVDAPGGDHHLSEDSVALDLGELLPDVPTDLEGRPRPLGPTSDAGCYEGAGVVFVDGFESGDSTLWSSSASRRRPPPTAGPGP